MTITYDEALREQIRAHLVGHDRRAVTDPTKRHAAVAVVLVDSEVGEDRVDPAPVDDWIAGRPMPEAGLDGRMDTFPEAPPSCCAGEPRASTAMPRSGPCRGAAWTTVRPRSRAARASWKRSSAYVGADSALGLLDDYPTAPATS